MQQARQTNDESGEWAGSLVAGSFTLSPADSACAARQGPWGAIPDRPDDARSSAVKPDDKIGLLDQGTLSSEAERGGDTRSFRVMIRELDGAPPSVLCDYDCHVLGALART